MGRCRGRHAADQRGIARMLVACVARDQGQSARRLARRLNGRQYEFGTIASLVVGKTHGVIVGALNSESCFTLEPSRGQDWSSAFMYKSSGLWSDWLPDQESYLQELRSYRGRHAISRSRSRNSVARSLRTPERIPLSSKAELASAGSGQIFRRR